MFKLLSQSYIDDIDSLYGMYQHESGAKLIYIKNNDSNKVFSISFKTPPFDDTGVFHIIEHCILCGSKKYDCKDPFNELAKGSLNTFLNAMTYSDKTMYPIASYNQKDFLNLMDVYLDSVFDPLIRERKQSFLQECGNLVLDSDKTYFNGIVYNEMKGAYSNPLSIIDDGINKVLFPDTCYKFSSGGRPEAITSLSYNEFLNTFEKYYNPSNSYIYLYGDLDFDQCVSHIEPYLQKQYKAYGKLDVTRQPWSGKPITYNEFYNVNEHDTSDGKNYLVSSYVINDVRDAKLMEGMRILNYILLSTQASPLKNGLKHMGHEITGMFSTEMLQPVFAIVVKNSKEDIEVFKNETTRLLTDLVKNGIENDLVQAALNRYEFFYREKEYGYHPKGLTYNIWMMSNWIYGAEPSDALKRVQLVTEIKKECGSRYFENLIEKYILNNNHAAHMTLEGKYGLDKKAQEIEEKRLNSLREGLKTEEAESIKADSESLRQYQSEEDTLEKLQKIPRISITDIKKESDEIKSYAVDEQILLTEIQADNISYVNFMFDTLCVKTEMLGYLGVLAYCLGKMDTKTHSYYALTNELTTYAGGHSITFDMYKSGCDEYLPKIVVRVKALRENIGKVTELVSDIICNTVFSDSQRLLSVIKELKSKYEKDFITSGHLLAISRAKSYIDKSERYKDKATGVGFYFFLVDILKNFEVNVHEIQKGLQHVMECIFKKSNLLIAASEEVECIKSFIASLPNGAVTVNYLGCNATYNIEAFVTASQVQYNAQASVYLKHNDYSGQLAVLNSVLDSGYLFDRIRIKGGAYGCGSNISRNGRMYMYSYRDPEIEKTIEVFKQSGKFLKRLDVTESEIERYIIGTINIYDRPLQAGKKHETAIYRHIEGITHAAIQKEREEILGVNLNSIKLYCDMIEACAQEDNICVFGNGTKIEEAKNYFQNIVKL